jgi:hypothetical protein
MQDGHHPSVERRRTHATGLLRRTVFEESLALLRAIGFSSDAVEYYRQVARKAHKLPHESARDVAETAAIPRARRYGGPATAWPIRHCNRARGRVRG